MTYEVLARKWRPKNFSELIGQHSVQKILTNALKQKRVYPVLLFAGPRGTGKTSTARILAKTLRCENRVNLLPCENCDDCLLIQQNRHLDVIEIDGASNNGVDAIRDLRDTVNYMPSTGSQKIYIIDEVHMLSNSAFNALLKTFEEPPDHVLFIMATTESHKIPQTILSRCQRLDFHLLSPNLIKKQLERICQKEEVFITEEALWIIAKQARGSLRDGQSLLDQMITFCGDNLTSEKIIENLGLSEPQIVLRALKALVHREEREMIVLLQTLRTKGNESKLFLQNLIEGLRDLLLLKKNPDNDPPLVQTSKQEIEQMKQEIETRSYEDLHFLFDMLLKGEREMAFCFDPQMVLEVLLLRFCNSPRLEQVTAFNPFTLETNHAKRDLKTDFVKEKEQSFTKKPIENDSSKPFDSEKILDYSDPSVETKEKSSKCSLDKKKIKKVDVEAENFEERLAFLAFLDKKDKNLSLLVEQFCLKKKSANSFYFLIPENFPYIKNKMDTYCQQLVKDHLSNFLNLKEEIKVEFLYSKTMETNLSKEKQQKAREDLLKQVQKHPFVKEVKDIFQVQIKSITKN